MGRRRVLDPETLGLLGRVVRKEAGALLQKTLEGEPGRVLRHALAAETREQVRGVVGPDKLGELARTLGQEAAELALDTASMAAGAPGVKQALDPEMHEHLRKITEALTDAAQNPFDPDSAEREDGELIRQLSPPVDAFVRGYFRFEVEGIDRVPRSAALLVSNHDTGTSFVQVLGMGARFYIERGYDERIVGLMHDALFDIPVMANVLMHLGAVRASHETANEAFSRGFKVYVAPGGAREAFRPYAERYKIKFGGRRGWIRLARRNHVPIVPVVFIGGQETFFVLNDGEYLAHNLGLKKRFRVDTLPIWLGLPFGVGVGPLFHLPLPAKCKVRFLDPIPVDDGPPGETDSEAESRLYEKVTTLMQEALTEMASERSLPVLG